jgi:hypothetical protein
MPSCLAGWRTPNPIDDGADPMSARDRDRLGRARNARPRDELGRPLPRTATARDDVPVVPDGVPVAPAEAADLGGRLLAEGRPFHAHEVFEAAWKSAPASEREFWRGLAQIAVGLTHARRGNARGAVALLRRGAARTRENPDNGGGIDAGYAAAQAQEVAERIEAGGVAAVTPADLLLRLRPDSPPPG